MSNVTSLCRRRTAALLGLALVLVVVQMTVAAAARAEIVPTLKVPRLSTTSSKSASFAVSWTAVGVAPGTAYDVQYRDGRTGPWLTWCAKTPLVKAQYPGAAGHTYYFRVAVDAAGVQGTWSPEKACVVPVDDKAFTYKRGWKSARAAAAFLRGTKYASAKRSSATLEFTGTALTLVVTKSKASGKADVFVRGEVTPGSGTWERWQKAKSLDLYARATKYRQAFAIQTWAGSAKRQVKVVVTGKKNRRSRGTRVDLDGVAVRDAAYAVPRPSLLIDPMAPTVEIGGRLQFSATIYPCLNKDVVWQVVRVSRSDGSWLSDGAGSITPAGLYTAPDKPSDRTSVDPNVYRYYLVVCRGVADPTLLYMAVEVVVTIGPAPELASVSPSRPMPLQPEFTEGYGDEGATITLTGRHFLSHGVGPEVMVCGKWAVVRSATDTSISATVPSGYRTWYGFASGYIYVRTRGQYSSDLYFTVTHVPPMPPMIHPSGINAAGLDDDNGSPGDPVRIYGWGWAPKPSDNVVRFGGGATAVATAFTQDPYYSDMGTITVPVPSAATTGPLSPRRLDGLPEWGEAGPVFTVQPATVVKLGAGMQAAGVVSLRYGNASAVSSQALSDSWMLTGSGFSKLRNGEYVRGAFYVEVSNGSITRTVGAKAASDTVAITDPLPAVLYDGLAAGAKLTARLYGWELTNRYTRSSPRISITVTKVPVYGAVKGISVPFPAGSRVDVSEGDAFAFSAGADSTSRLSAPGLWSGALPFGGSGPSGTSSPARLQSKLFLLDRPATYTVVDATTGATLTIVVHEEGVTSGVAYSLPVTGGLSQPATLGFGGARLNIPAGALAAADLPAGVDHWDVTASHAVSTVSSFDPIVRDGGSTFSVHFSPEPARLLKPLTISIPYAMAGRASAPRFGLWDPGSQLYYDLGGVNDAVEHVTTFTLPAGTYSGASSAARRAPAGAADAVAAAAAPVIPKLRINGLFDKLAAFSNTATSLLYEDPVRKLRVDCVGDAASSSYISPAKANEILQVAADTYDKLQAHSWPVPGGWVVLHVRDYGPVTAYQGATTKAVFGQPWVYVNANLTSGVKLATAVSHEMGHVFERQISTNITTKWIDEAVAEWVAWETLKPSRCDLSYALKTGSEFPTLQIPTGFYYGYTTEQAYAAGAFIIWLSDTYGASRVLDIYLTLQNDPAYWYDSYATFTEVTGVSMSALASGFGKAYWQQAEAPLKDLVLPSWGLDKIIDWTGRTMTESRPPYSSRGVTIGVTDAFRPTLSGAHLMASATGLDGAQWIYVYRDPHTAGAAPGVLTQVAALEKDHPAAYLGAYDGSSCYRLVYLNFSGSVTASMRASIVPVRIDSVSPNGGSKSGGYSVTVSGRGFGAKTAASRAMFGAWIIQGSAITAWTDTSITFTAPNMGSTTGAIDVRVYPALGGASNAATFTLY